MSPDIRLLTTVRGFSIHWAILFAALAFPSVKLAAAEDPTVLITGTNRGIGLELARQYAERDWNVIATARRPEEADDLIAIQRDHPRLVIVQLDVTDHQRIDELAAEYRGRPIDILINNAGINGGHENAEVARDSTEGLTGASAGRRRLDSWWRLAKRE